MAIKTEKGLCAWSHSRANTMTTCQRQFYLSYCAPARWDHPDPRMRDLYLLKQVKPVAMWKGDVVHQAVAEFFRNLQTGRVLPYPDLIQFATQLAKDQWTFSQAGRYRKQGRKRAGTAFAALLEHEYKVQPAESFNDALCHIRNCLANFYEIDAREGISVLFQQGHGHLIEPPAWGEGATTFEIPGVAVTVKVDLAFSALDNQYHIFDWKTGKTVEDVTHQLELYILWAHLSLGLALASITAHEVSLHSVTSSRHQLTEPGKFHRLDAVRRSANLINALTSSLDGCQPDIHDFNYARYLATCRRCPLQRVCQEMS